MFAVFFPKTIGCNSGHLPRFICRALICFALTLIWASTVSAAEPTPSPAPFRAPQPVADVAGLERLGGYFALLLILAGGGVYLLKKGIPLRGLRGGSGKKLQIQEMRSLGSRQFLVVVEYEENKMLLGVTPGKIDYLCPLEGRPAASAADFGALVPADIETPANERMRFDPPPRSVTPEEIERRIVAGRCSPGEAR